MWVRKRFDAEKIRINRWVSGILLISIRENVNGITISPEEEKLKSTNWRCGGVRGPCPLGEGVESNEVRTRGILPPFFVNC